MIFYNVIVVVSKKAWLCLEMKWLTAVVMRRTFEFGGGGGPTEQEGVPDHDYRLCCIDLKGMQCHGATAAMFFTV